MADTIKTFQRDTNALAIREPDAIDTPTGMTTGQKVAVGVGLTGATGLAGFGLYRLGVRRGWWGRAPLIVIDDSDGKDGKDGKDGNDGKDGSSGGSRSRSRAIGKPPNMSGDPEGYNTTRFNAPGPVRLTMILLGYKVDANGETLVPNNQPNAEVMRFQREWNRVIRGLDSGKVKPPSVDKTSLLKLLRGLLDEDGIPGKNTLNGLEIAISVALNSLTKWSTIVGQA